MKYNVFKKQNLESISLILSDKETLDLYDKVGEIYTLKKFDASSVECLEDVNSKLAQIIGISSNYNISVITA